MPSFVRESTSPASNKESETLLAVMVNLGILASATRTTYSFRMPAVVIGTWLRLRLFNRIDDGKFRQLVLLFLSISGGMLIV